MKSFTVQEGLLLGSFDTVHSWKILLIFLSAYLVHRIIGTIHDVYFGPLSKFPGPKWWAASNLPLAFALTFGQDAVAKTKLHEQYGPVVRISPTELSFNSGQGWKTIYGHRIGAGKKTFEKDPRFYVEAPDRELSIITTLSDEDHSRQRRVLAHSFSDKSLKEQEPLFKQWAQLLVRKLTEVSGGPPVNIVSYYNFTTFDIMADVTFAEPLHMLEGSKYVPWVKIIFDNLRVSTRLSVLRKLPVLWIIPSILGRLLRKKQIEHANYSAVRVDRRLANPPDKPNLWTEVINRAAKDSKMSLGEMHSNSSTFMIAGTETTATLLSGITYFLLRNPSMMARLLEELRTTFKHEDDITVEILASLPYLNACLEEGLRMYPPVPTGLPRIVPEGGAQVGNDFVPAGTIVSVTQLAAYRSKENWYEPYNYLPERWLGEDERFAKDDRSSFQPFSTGPRNCLGRNLAYHEARVLLTEVLWNFDLELSPKSENWTKQKIYTLWDKPPLLVTLRPVVR